MRELEYLKIINEKLTDNSYLGDDCAFIAPNVLGAKGLYVTQDTLVEDIHFTFKTITPYQLGEKAVHINFSDLASNCAKPMFLSISLSLPTSIDKTFVEGFYEGVNNVCETHNAIVIGGDITGSDKIVVSICAIGEKISDVDVARKFAKKDDVVFTTGFHGDSAGGLKQILKNIKNTCLATAHLAPTAQFDKSFELLKIVESENVKKIAMMDTSDGLADAMYRIAKESNVSIECKFKDIPISEELRKEFPDEYKNLTLWGGEDFQLVGCVPMRVFEKLDKNKFFKIGTVKEKDNDFFVKINFGKESLFIDEKMYKSKSFDHFEEQK